MLVDHPAEPDGPSARQAEQGRPGRSCQGHDGREGTNADRGSRPRRRWRAAARQLASTDGVTEVVLRDRQMRPSRRGGGVSRCRGAVEHGPYRRGRGRGRGHPRHAGGTHVGEAALLVAAGRPVVSCSDAVSDVTALLELGPEAEARGIPVVIGAAFAPG